MTDTLSRVTKLRGVYFRWDESLQSKSGRDIGIIAQELESVFPELVSTNKDGYRSVKYYLLAPVLIESIKELNDKYEELSEKYEILYKKLVEIGR